MRVSAGLPSFLQALRKNSFPCLLQLLEAATCRAPFSSFEGNSVTSLTVPKVSTHSSVISFTFKDSCDSPDNPGSSPYFKVSWLANLISSAILILLCHVTQQVQGLGYGHSGVGALFCLLLYTCPWLDFSMSILPAVLGCFPRSNPKTRIYM